MAEEELRIRDRSQDKSRSGFEKREKRRRIRKLQDAIIQKDRVKIQELLEEDFEVDFQYRGQTALQLAVKEGETEICQKLVERGADINVCDAQKNSILNTACWKGHTDIVKLLVKSGAQLNAQNDHESTPLFTAAYKGHFDIVSVLVEACCDLDLQNVHGQSPLHAAVKNEHISCVHRLVDGGCNIDFIDTDFKSPLMVASELGLTEVAKILLDRGASVNLKDRAGETAVLLAAVQGHSEIIKELANHKADVDMATTNGRVPLIGEHDAGFTRTTVESFKFVGASFFLWLVGFLLNRWDVISWILFSVSVRKLTLSLYAFMEDVNSSERAIQEYHEK